MRQVALMRSLDIPVATGENLYPSGVGVDGAE